MRKFLIVLAVLVLVPPLPAQTTFLDKRQAAWLKDLAEGEPAQQRSAAFALGKLGDASPETLRALTKALGNGSASVRDAAAFALGELAVQSQAAVWREAKDELPRLLRDEDKRVRRSAAFALGSCGEEAREALADLARTLREDGEAGVRRNAAWALGRVGKGARDKGAVDALVVALESDGGDALVLRDVAGALGEIGRPAASPAVRPLAKVVRTSQDPAVRKTALNTLVHLVDPSLAKEAEDQNRVVVQALHEALREGDAAAKGLIAGALANLGEHAGPAIKDLAALADDERAPADARRNAILALTKAPKAIRELPEREAQGVVATLARGLDRKQPLEVRIFAAEAIHSLGFPIARAALKPVLQAISRDPDRTVRQRSIWVFLNADNFEELEGAKETLLGVLRKPGEEKFVRYDAARSLARALGPESPREVVVALEDMLKDDMIVVYESTNADVKGRSESSGGQSTVKKVLGGDARFMAAHALTFIGPKAKEHCPKIIGLLKKLEQSKDERNQKFAREALDKLGE